MRIVATSDTHFPFSEDRVPNGDLFIHAGDLMYSGYPDEWYPRLKSLAAIDIKNKLIVPGNHDAHMDVYQGIARAELRRQANTKIGTGIVAMCGLQILCIPYVTGLPGWSFNVEEEWLENWLNQFSGNHIDVVVSHSPPYKILDACGSDNYGALAMNKWFYSLKRKPKIWICGHIHESYGRTTIDGCTFYNVAMCDEGYAQSNKVVTIDIEV